MKIEYNTETQEAQSLFLQAKPQLSTEIIVSSQEDVDRAKVMITNLKGLLKSIEAKRLSITSFIDAAKKNTQAIFNPMKDKINQAIARFESAVIEYHRKKEEEIRAKEEA